MAAVLRAQTSNDEQYDDPSEDLLFMLLDELQPDDYVIVERPDDQTQQTYAQVLRTGSQGYLIERREGSAETHAFARSADMRSIHADLTTWAHGVARPYVLAWEPGFAE